jgi:hypothetical protein
VYTDYLSNEEMIEKAKSNPRTAQKTIPKIDFVWAPGSNLLELIPQGRLFDFALAAHVLEHVPNPVGWLNQIFETMENGATLRIILPDRRQSMDYFRRETSLAQLIGYWLERPSVPTPFQVADFMLGCLDGRSCNDMALGDVPNNRPFYPAVDAVSTAEFVYNERMYIDAHCTVWTPDHFHEVIGRLVELEIMNVAIVPVRSSKLEFVVDLIKKGEPKRLPSTKIYSADVKVAECKEILTVRSSLIKRLKSVLTGR